MIRLHHILALTLPLMLAGCGPIYRAVGGAFAGDPERMQEELSPGAARLIEEALDGIGPGEFTDFHVHMISTDINPTWLSFCHPVRRGRTMVYLSAAGVEPGPSLTDDYIRRLRTLIRTSPMRGRYLLYAWDRAHSPDGAADLRHTPIHVANETVVTLAEEYPDTFIPVVSVHPYRADAVPTLERWARRGVRHVKWLPNAMGMDPSDERIEPFYEKMREYGMILLSHTGRERAVESIDHELGNPLLLRKPLDLGVRVIALHAAGDGRHTDLDDRRRRRLPSYQLLFRMMANPDYDGLLFADTSALTFQTHVAEPLKTLLGREDLQRRFVHGSDYPLTGVNFALRTSVLVQHGFIDHDQRILLDEIYQYNPLLFDFVVKRTISHPQTGGRLPPSLFTTPDALRTDPWPPPRAENGHTEGG